jgi:hypothetical protein
MIGKDVTGARAEGPASRTAVRWDCGRSQVPKKSRAARTSSASLARCASAVMALPATEVAKPAGHQPAAELVAAAQMEAERGRP